MVTMEFASFVDIIFENFIELFCRLILRPDKREKSSISDMMSERLFLSSLARMEVSSTKLMKVITVLLGLSLMPIRYLLFMIQLVVSLQGVP